MSRYLWEAWLGQFTDTRHEAIVNKVQRKGVAEYRQLMTQSLIEAHRVLRRGHWMLLVFMNSSKEVWSALKAAILDAGFQICQVDVFDKQHGTFKHYVSENTAGCDLVLHCRKPTSPHVHRSEVGYRSASGSIIRFLETVDIARRTNVYLHVDRPEELDFRSLYSEWIARTILEGVDPIDFARFRAVVEEWLDRRRRGHVV